MTSQKRSKRVREPVQVYLDGADRSLLDDVARAMDISRAEVLRRGLRGLARQVMTQRQPGWSLDQTIALLGDAADVPSDLAERHDEYLYWARLGDECGSDRSD
ncbi:MAG: hypothetical protein ACE5HT_07110 [Gemmatimonadales bacterium]